MVSRGLDKYSPYPKVSFEVGAAFRSLLDPEFRNPRCSSLELRSIQGVRPSQREPWSRLPIQRWSRDHPPYRSFYSGGWPCSCDVLLPQISLSLEISHQHAPPHGQSSLGGFNTQPPRLYYRLVENMKFCKKKLTDLVYKERLTTQFTSSFNEKSYLSRS